MGATKEQREAAKKLEDYNKSHTGGHFISDTRNDRDKAGYSKAQGDGPASNSGSHDYAYGHDNQPSYTSSSQMKKKGKESDEKKSKK